MARLRDPEVKARILGEADLPTTPGVLYDSMNLLVQHSLHKLYVLPGAQGTGAGKALLQAVEAAARTAGDERIELNVNRFNPSLQFYLRRGFGVLRDEVLDIGEGYVMDDHVLVKAL